MGVLKGVPLLQGDSLLAFLLGTILGLVFLSLISKTWTPKLPGPLSLVAACIACVLFWLLHINGDRNELNGVVAWSFFFLLSFRFCAWFLARVLRSDISSGHGQKISWVELSYLSGIVLGLAVWQRSGMSASISQALLIDAALQCVAAGFDFYFLRRYLPYLPEAALITSAKSESKIRFNFIWYTYLAAAVVFMTVGCTAPTKFGHFWKLSPIKNGQLLRVTV